MKQQLDQITTANLTGSTSIVQMSVAEEWSDPDRYCLALAEKIRRTDLPLDRQRERLQALAQVGEGLGDHATANELARHTTVLTAIFERFVKVAADLAEKDPVRNARAAEIYLSGALRAQKAALLTLGAVKTIRDANKTTV